MTAIQAELIAYKTMKTREIVQITLEAPIETARKITEALGWPIPGESIWVAVARIEPEKEEI